MLVRARLFALPLSAALLAAPVAAPLPAAAEPVIFDLDPSHTTVAFWVDHIGYARTLGWFTEVSGSFVYDSETQELSDVRVVIGTASIFSNDDRRDDHVRNADFLDVESHPEMVFVADSGEPTSDTTGVVRGDLTLLGETRPVELTLTLNKDAAYPFGHGKRALGISAETTIVRSEFGMNYALGGIVGDEVQVMLEFEAIARD